MNFFYYYKWSQKQLHVSCNILIFAAFWFARFFNSFDYIRKQEVKRTLACVARWKFYHCILNFFL